MSDILALERQLNETTDQKLRVDLLNRLAFELRFSQFQRAILFAEEAYTLSRAEIASTGAYLAGQASSLVNLSWFSADQGKYELSLAQAEEALQLFLQLEQLDGQARSLGLIGCTLMYMGDYPSALENHLQQLKLYQAQDNLLGQASALNALGTVYDRLGEHTKAVGYYQQALRICQELNDEDRKAITLNNIAICYYQQGLFSEALEYGHEALALGKSQHNDYVQTWANNCLGDSYLVLKSYDEALKHYSQNLELTSNGENEPQRLDTLISIGRLYNQQQNPRQALTYLTEAVSIAQKSNTTPHLYRCHEAIALSHESLGNFKDALIHFQQFHELKEIVINIESEQRLAYLDAQRRLESTEKESEIYQLRNVELRNEISAHKKTETALIAAKEEAIEAQLRAESANRAKSAFLSSMSHELRTPLNAILGFGQLLQVDEELNDEQLDNVETIVSSGNHLLALISEILDLSKIEAGKLELQHEPCTLEHVVDSVVNLVQMQAKAKKLTLDVDISSITPLVLLLDETRLCQVLVNLLHNAIKFTRVGSVRLTVIPLSNENLVLADPLRFARKYRFQVIDSGVGMSLEQLEVIFQPFEQVGSTTSRAEGTGLGLTITKRLVELMGGILDVTSQVDIGSTFSFDIEFEVVEP